MLLTIHNLPLGIQYGDIKEVLLKCGLRDTILDNLQDGGNGMMKVTVGVMEEEDAAILVRKINGIYFRGNQLYVEDKRQAKQESEQPYRSSVPQQSQQYYSEGIQGQPMVFDYNSQVQAMANTGMFQQYTPMMNYMYAQQTNGLQSVQNAYMVYGDQQLMSQYPGTNEYAQQPYPGTPGNNNLFDHRSSLHGLQDAGRSGEVVPPRNDRRRPISPSSNRANTQPDLKRAKWDSKNERSDQGFNPENSRDHSSNNRGGYFSSQRGDQSSSQHGDQFSSQRGDQSSSQRGDQFSRQRGDQFPSQRGDQSLNQRGGQSSSQRGDQSLSQRGGRSSNQRGGLSSSHSGDQSMWQRRGNEDRSSRPYEDRSSRPYEDRSSRPNEDRKGRPYENRKDRPYEDRKDRPYEDRSSRPYEDRSSRPYDDRSRSDRKSRWDNSSDRGPPSHQDRRTSPQRGPTSGPSGLGNINTTHSKTVITKAMVNVMYDMSANLNMEWETSGPSVLKAVLSKAIYMRIVDIVGDANMDHEEMTRLYRDRYPRNGDYATYEKIREKLADNRGCSDAEMEGFLISLVAKGLQRPMRPTFGEPKNVPFLSNSQPAMLKISAETARFLNLPDLTGSCPLKTAIRRVICLRIDAITGNAPMGYEEIWKRYRLKYPLLSDRAMHTCIKQKIAEQPHMTELQRNDYLSTFLDGLPPSCYGRSDFKNSSYENPPQNPQNMNVQNPSNQNSSFRNQNPSTRNPVTVNLTKEFSKPQTLGQKFKTCHTKAMGTILYETVQNLGISRSMAAPNPLKTTLRKVIIVRLESIMKKKPMDPVYTCEKYREIYPHKEDVDLLKQIRQKISGSKNMHPEELKEFATTFIKTTRQSRSLTRKPPKSLPQVAPKLPANAVGTSKSHLRAFCMQATARILQETATFLKISVSMKGMSPLETELRKVISTRVKEIIGNLVLVWDVIETCKRYRELYPITGDADMYKRIQNVIAEKGDTKEGRPDPGSKDYSAEFVGNQNKPIVKKVCPSEKPKPVPPPSIPSYPQGDKKVFMKQKKQHIAELRTLSGYNLSPLQQKVLQQEIKAIRKLLKDVFANPRNGEETLVFRNVNQDNCIESYAKLLTFHLSKRLLDGGTKLCRIYGTPKLPNRRQLQNLLNDYKCLSLKKSAKNPFWTATFDSYATVDSLCMSGPLDAGENIMVTFKHMHVAPTKPKYSQKHAKSMRKRFVKSLIDNSNVNLLDKDWPLQVEKEKKDKAQKEEADDVILVGDSNVIEPIEISDDDPPETIIGDKSKDTTEAIEDDTQFLHEDFKVIDEVKESDNDDKEEEPNNGDNTIIYTYSNQIDDNWDQNGEDWGTVENLASVENEDGENGAVVGETDVYVEEPNADVGKDDTNVDKDDTNVHEDDDDDVQEIAHNAEEIDIANIDWDNVDDDDLEDY